ncbi:Stk1 family PASTA domain-containing Ser/Thr kinase [Winkia neuii]|uniref:Stk1 family PASTA domain-containing Ser/Thr kinase n=1 Tax=Winkia neuii TaxID=33007 RepID=UPI0009E6CBDC|nr:Stk1 family PASTA domain-containing Ser/Thr kinase [Winkia neuii]
MERPMPQKKAKGARTVHFPFKKPKVTDTKPLPDSAEASTTTVDPLLGKLVDGRYLVLSKIASGGMATVYKARDERLDRPVALKVMHPHLSGSADLVARFRREARATARINHPSVVAVFDQGIVNGAGYLVMELVNGTNLRERLRKEGALPLGESLSIIASVLEALAPAHRSGLIHRDVKPENVLLPAAGGVKVADFGLARAVSDATMATTGSVLGTVAYIPPELVTSGEADARSDIYSVGIMAYELIAGHPPYEASSPIAVAWSHVHEDVPRLSTSLPWIPSEVDDLICAMAAREGDDRPQDGASAARYVREVLATLDPKTLERRAEVAPVEEPAEVEPAQIAKSSSTAALDYGSGTSALPLGAIDSPKKARPTKNWPALIGVAIIVATLVIGGVWYFVYGPGRHVTVPDVVGLQAQTAEKLVQDAELTLDKKLEYSDTVPKGIVVSSSPSAKKKVKLHTKIRLVVSKGVHMVSLPDVVGMDKEQALATLRKAPLSIGKVSEEYSDSIPKNKVVSTTPTAPQSLRHHTKIALVVSKGREPVKIPDLTGKTASEANKIAADLGLRATVTEEYSNEVEKDKIIRQDPKGPTDGFRRDPISYVISLGPEEKEVPNLRGRKMEDAKAELEKLGFKVNVQSKLLGIDPHHVYDQTPKAGQKAKVGSTVILIHV